MAGRKKTVYDSSLLGMTTEYLVSNWYSFTKEQKIEIALKIAPKGISDKHELTGSLDVSGILSRMAAVSNAN